MKKRKSSSKERKQPLSAAGFLFVVLFAAAFSFVYFHEETQKNKGNEKQNGKVVKGKAFEDTDGVKQLVVNGGSGEEMEMMKAKTNMRALAPKNIITPQKQTENKNTVVAYAHSLNDRTRTANGSLTTEIQKEKHKLTTATVGKIVIIIDDLGNNPGIAKELMNMDQRITFSVLPKLKYSKQIAEDASLKNKEVILHLPMEPLSKKNKPGPGVITDDMTPEEIQKQVVDDIKSVPHIVGMNNHMGSKAASNADVMKSVLSVVKDEGLFYVDSVTSAKSKGYNTAQKLNLPSAKRDVFLDGIQDKKYVKSQIKKLVEIAKKKGLAVGIGHPHQSTVDALKEMLPQLEKEGIQIVPASEVVK